HFWVRIQNPKKSWRLGGSNLLGRSDAFGAGADDGVVAARVDAVARIAADVGAAGAVAGCVAAVRQIRAGVDVAGAGLLLHADLGRALAVHDLLAVSAGGHVGGVRQDLAGVGAERGVHRRPVARVAAPVVVAAAGGTQEGREREQAKREAAHVGDPTRIFAAQDPHASPPEGQGGIMVPWGCRAPPSAAR